MLSGRVMVVEALWKEQSRGGLTLLEAEDGGRLGGNSMEKLYGLKFVLKKNTWNLIWYCDIS